MTENNESKYLKLRNEYPYFIYEGFDISENNLKIIVSFNFNISNKHFFNPILEIPKKDFHFKLNINDERLKNIIFNIGMIELISYWKATCSPEIIIKSYSLNDEQIGFWKKVYFNGLGEFFYMNSIKADIKDFASVKCLSDERLKNDDFTVEDNYIIPVGGGKDSAVTIDILQEAGYTVKCFVVNQRRATTETIEKSGIPEKNVFEINRTIDKNLLKLNEEGYLNGHTPFSALLAFLSSFAAIITGTKHIALSNESSANEPTIADTGINHQYSKSYEFEKDFRGYLKKYVTESVNYFSFLRPLNELQIAKLFSAKEKYFNVFKSCNAGSKTDEWCCNCPKCLFTFIILSPFISSEKLLKIFGENLFEKVNLLFSLEQLTGISEEKPFECIGTIEEINVALNMTIKTYGNKQLPYLLQYYSKTEKFSEYKNINPEILLKQFNRMHFLPEGLEKLLNKQIHV
ncbi:MAG: hypothetical protein PHD97_10265 [Bacteroidales bacterium]|nr:hypothetical protein [Bacteroidales bacterium]